MTIGKEAIQEFWIHLSMVVVLFHSSTCWRCKESMRPRLPQPASLELADATNDVAFQMMQNRLYLSNYLLSGDSGKWTDERRSAIAQPTNCCREESGESDQERSASTGFNNWSRPGAKSLLNH